MSEETQQSEQTKEVVYVSPNTPNLKFRIDDFQYEIQGGSMRLTPEEAEVLDTFLLSRKGAALRNTIKKVDYANAARIAREHVQIEGGRAVKGAFTTMHMDQMRADRIKASAEMAHLSDPEALAKFTDDLAHGDMLVQESVDAGGTSAPEAEAALPQESSPTAQSASPVFGRPSVGIDE